MDIKTLGRTTHQPVEVGARRPQQGVGPVHPSPAETPLPQRTEPVSLGQAEPPVILARPPSVQSLYQIEPPLSGSLSWDQSLKQTLHHLAEPDGWATISRGLGQLSVRRQFNQRAEAFLMPPTEAPEKVSHKSSASVGTMRFSATLASGQKITFDVHAEAGHGLAGRSAMAFRALDIHYSTEADLTDDERAELDALSRRLADFVSHFAANGEPDLSRLRLSDLSEIQAIDLYLHISDEKTVSVRYDRSQSGDQTLDMRWNGRRLELQIDSDARLHGFESGRLESLRSVLLENLQKARAERGDTQVILRALTLFDSTLSRATELTTDTALNAGSASLPKGSEALLTGLPDYQLTFKGAIERPMRNTEHGDKYSGIRNLTLGQATQTTKQHGVTRITQTQTVDLNAAYFSALSHLEDPDFARVNFNWHEINESHQLSSQQVWQDATLHAATLGHSAKIDNLRETWSEGVLLSERQDQKQGSRALDVLTLIQRARPNASAAQDAPKATLSAREAQSQLQTLLNPVQTSWIKRL